MLRAVYTGRPRSQALAHVGVDEDDAVFIQHEDGPRAFLLEDTGLSEHVSVLDYAPAGTPRNGSVDWTAYIQAAIDAVTGNANPATTSRVPTAAVYIPAGQYLITAPLVIRSVHGFRLMGDGPRLTILYAANGSDLDSLLEIDGSAQGVFENFTLHSTGTGRADKMLNLHWSTAAARSTSANTFRNVEITGTYRTAFAIGTIAGELGRQVDHTKFYNCIATAQWTAGETADWQNAWEIGNGTHGNNLNHVLFGCGWANPRYGMFVNASSASAYGSQASGGEIHFYVIGVAGPFVVDGMRFEGTQRLLWHAGTAATARVSLRNIDYTGNNIHADGYWIRISTGGSILLENLLCMYATAPVIYINAPGGASGQASCVAKGITTQSTYASAFEIGAFVSLTVQNYQQIASNNTVQTVTPMNVRGPGGLNWSPS